MKVKIEGYEIECPDKPWMVALVAAMNYWQARQLYSYQQRPKNWPLHTHMPEYCLYMGSAEIGNEDCSIDKVDFYHYEGRDPIDYSAAIVDGNGDGDYGSGWPQLALHRATYKEQLRREFVLGLLTVDDLIKVGIAGLGAARESYHTIRPARTGFRLGILTETETETEEE